MASTKRKVEFDWISLSQLTMPAHAQRSIHKQSRVDKIVADFDPDAIGVLEVSCNGGSKFEVIDGWHRTLAMRQMGWGDQKVPCNVHRNLTQQEEAGLFNKLNDETSVRFIDRFRVRVNAGDPTAVAVNGVVSSLGLCVSDQAGDGHITAVRACERVYTGVGTVARHDNPDALRTSLRILTGAWGKPSASLAGALIEGAGLLVLRHGKRLEWEDLAKKLSPYPGGPSGLIGTAKAIRAMRGGTMPHCVASVMTDTYNKGRRAHKLPDWWSS